jgi:hypothetical protein
MKDQQDLQELNVLEKIQVNLPPFYLTESLDSDSLKKVLESSASVYYGLLIIKNGLKQYYDFATFNDPNFELTAMVKVDYAVIGKAKAQTWSITHLKSLLSLKPKYKIVCALRDLKSNKYIYRFIETSNKEKSIYKNIENCYTDLQIILDSFE